MMFTEESFAVFDIEGLDARMAAIRAEIQPVFQQLDEYFVSELRPLVGHVLPIHIAQHRRRTAHAPDFTWSAMGGDNRGYKKYPHFQLGITAGYCVMWLSFIDNPLNEQKMADAFLADSAVFQQLPSDFVINLDHTRNTYEPLTEEGLAKGLKRWRDVKKGEFQIGRVLTREELVKLTPAEARQYMLETYTQLVPLYQLAMTVK